MGDANLPNIPPKMTKGRSVIGSPCWVSNGAWAIRRAAINNECLFAPRVAEVALGAEEYREMADEKFDRIIPKDLSVLTFERDVAGIIGTTPEQNAVGFRCPETGAVVLINEQFARLFGLHVLYGNADGQALFRGAVDSEWSPRLLSADLIVMPIKVEDVEWRSVLSLVDRIHFGDRKTSGRQGRLPLEPPAPAPDSREPGYTPTITLYEPQTGSENHNTPPVSTDTPPSAEEDADASTDMVQHPEEATAEPTSAGKVASSDAAEVPFGSTIDLSLLSDLAWNPTPESLASVLERATYGHLELALAALKGKHGAEERRVAIKRELRKRGRAVPPAPAAPPAKHTACSICPCATFWASGHAADVCRICDHKRDFHDADPASLTTLPGASRVTCSEFGAAPLCVCGHALGIHAGTTGGCGVGGCGCEQFASVENYHPGEALHDDTEGDEV